MRVGFKFSNLCGTVYKCGNVLFTSDGNSLISPVGNRVTVFDLVEYVVAEAKDVRFLSGASCVHAIFSAWWEQTQIHDARH
jgi:hypothetical protein